MCKKKRTYFNPDEKYGRLTVLEKTDEFYLKSRLWLCKCDCGKIIKARQNCLKTGAKKSCGCLNSEKASERLVTHGMTNTRIYRIWHGMINRCDNDKVSSYKRYGGRGIKYCDEFKTFEGFYAAMKEGYSDDLTLDRIDNDKDYEPSNLRWVTQKVNSRNRSNNTKVIDPFDGEEMILVEIADKYQLNYKYLLQHLHQGYDLKMSILIETKPELLMRTNRKYYLK